MEGKFESPLTEVEHFFRVRHQYDFPMWETREEIRLPHQVGFPRMFRNGQWFVLLKNGATELQPGYYVEPVITVIQEHPLAKTVEELQERITFTTPAGTIVTEDQFQDGFLQVTDHTGKGYNLPIAGNTAGGSAGATDTIEIYLSVHMPIELDLTTDAQIVTSEFRNIRLGTATPYIPQGLPPIVVPPNEYFWSQVKGRAVGFTAGVDVSVFTSRGQVGLKAGGSGQLDVMNAATDAGQRVARLARLPTADVAAGGAIDVILDF